MRISLHSFICILWVLLSWGIIVLSKFGILINQIVLKIFVPLTFIIVLLIDKVKFKVNYTLIFFIIFSLWASLSVFYTVNQEMTLKYLQQILGNIILWYITFRLYDRFENKELFLLILGLAFMFHAFAGLIVPNEDELTSRMSGIYTNANELGFAMWYAMMIFTFFYLKIKKKTLKTLILFSFILFLWVLVFSGSRKSFLASLVSIFLTVFLINYKNFKRVLIISPLFVIAYIFLNELILFSTPLGERLSAENVERSAGFRTELVQEGLAMFVESPFIGVGLGSFTSFSTSGMMSHNDYVEILSSLGIIGLVLYISIFYVFFKQTRFLLNFKQSYLYGTIGLVFLVGYLILGMGRPAFLDPVAIMIFAVFQSMIQKENSKIYNAFQNNLTLNK